VTTDIVYRPDLNTIRLVWKSEGVLLTETSPVKITHVNPECYLATGCYKKTALKGGATWSSNLCRLKEQWVSPSARRGFPLRPETSSLCLLSRSFVQGIICQRRAIYIKAEAALSCALGCDRLRRVGLWRLVLLTVITLANKMQKPLTDTANIGYSYYLW